MSMWKNRKLACPPVLLILLCLLSCYERFEPEVPTFYGVVAKETSKVLLVTHSTSNVKYNEIAYQNHKKYAEKHGYNYAFRLGNWDAGNLRDPNNRDRVRQLGLYWQKIQAVYDGLIEGSSADPRYDIVMWIDADMLITNSNIRIEDILEKYPSKRFLIAPDNVGGRQDKVNAGAFIVLNNQEHHLQSVAFFKTILGLYPTYKNLLTPEQQAIQDVIYGYVVVSQDKIYETPRQNRSYLDSEIVPWAAVIPQRQINAFFLGPDEAAWQVGDFIAHFALVFDKKTTYMRALSDCLVKYGETSYECEAVKIKSIR